MGGLVLSAVSLLSCLNIIGVDEEGHKWGMSESLQSFYTFFFGFVIFICDLPESWANRVFPLQTKLFHYFNFLANQTGRSFFYFYVGSITLALLPESDFWK